MPVLVVADEITDDAATVDRIVASTPRTPSAPLASSEHVGVVAQFLDLALTIGQIRRRTRMAKTDVAAALATTRSPVAANALSRYGTLTLGQAAILAEFEDETEAVEILLVAVTEGETRFKHVARRKRDDRDLRAAKAPAVAELEAAGVTPADVRHALTSMAARYWTAAVAMGHNALTRVIRHAEARDLSGATEPCQVSTVRCRGVCVHRGLARSRAVWKVPGLFVMRFRQWICLLPRPRQQRQRLTTSGRRLPEQRRRRRDSVAKMNYLLAWRETASLWTPQHSSSGSTSVTWTALSM